MVLPRLLLLLLKSLRVLGYGCFLCTISQSLIFAIKFNPKLYPSLKSPKDTKIACPQLIIAPSSQASRENQIFYDISSYIHSLVQMKHQATEQKINAENKEWDFADFDQWIDQVNFYLIPTPDNKKNEKTHPTYAIKGNDIFLSHLEVFQNREDLLINFIVRIFNAIHIISDQDFVAYRTHKFKVKKIPGGSIKRGIDFTIVHRKLLSYQPAQQHNQKIKKHLNDIIAELLWLQNESLSLQNHNLILTELLLRLQKIPNAHDILENNIFFLDRILTILKLIKETKYRDPLQFQSLSCLFNYFNPIFLYHMHASQKINNLILEIQTFLTLVKKSPLNAERQARRINARIEKEKPLYQLFYSLDASLSLPQENTNNDVGNYPFSLGKKSRGPLFHVALQSAKKRGVKNLPPSTRMLLIRLGFGALDESLYNPLSLSDLYTLYQENFLLHVLFPTDSYVYGKHKPDVQTYIWNLHRKRLSYEIQKKVQDVIETHATTIAFSHEVQSLFENFPLAELARLPINPLDFCIIKDTLEQTAYNMVLQKH